MNNDPVPTAPALIEVVFALDTTGSMGGLIEGAKAKIWDIANGITRRDPVPKVRFGLVAYRDRCDEYIVKRFDLTEDLDAIYGHLQKFRALGGGDMPEDVNAALAAAVQTFQWSPAESVLKIIFLVGDAPPHMDYPDQEQYPELCAEAVKRGIFINTIQCGDERACIRPWKEIAQMGGGEYSRILQDGNVQVVHTPYDEELARVSADLGGTTVSYGDESSHSSMREKLRTTRESPAASTSTRILYTMRQAKVVLGDDELLYELDHGGLKFEDINPARLPDRLRHLSREELRAELDRMRGERARLYAQASALQDQRQAYLARERRRQQSAAGLTGSFDEEVEKTIRAQARSKGIEL